MKPRVFMPQLLIEASADRLGDKVTSQLLGA